MNKIIYYLLGILLFVIIQMNDVNAGDRKILTERFTSSTCVPCRVYNPTLEAFLNSSDPNKVTNISYHLDFPAPGNDPMYHINPTDNNARRVQYGVSAIPAWFFDGVSVVPNQGVTPLQAAYNARINVLSPVTIVVTESVNGNTVTVKADVYCEGLIANPNVTIQFAVIEGVVYYIGTNQETSFTHVMRKFLPSANGTKVILLPGNKVSYEYSYVMDPAWNPALIRNLVFVETSARDILNCASATANFDLVSSPGFKVVNQGQSQNGNFMVKIPSVVSGYSSPVTFTSEVIPATPGVDVQFTGGNVISNFPDSLGLNVTSTSGVPAGEYKVILTGTNTNGIVHKTAVNYLVGKNYISVGSHRGSLLSFKADNLTYNSSRAFLWDLNSNHTIEAISPQTFGNVKYLYNNWSNGGSQTQTITIGTQLSNYTSNYRVQYRLLGTAEPTGIPVSVVGANVYYDSASVNNVSVSANQVQFENRTYYFNRWEGTGSGSYTGPAPIAQVTMNAYILQKAIFDTINVGISNYNSLIPDKFALYQNYPNPFNPTTSIKFDIAKSSFTSIKIYDMIGKEISNLVNQNLNPGSYEFTFNASDYSSGIYYYKIETESFNEIKKMMLIK